MDDMVNSPKHYRLFGGDLEVMDLILDRCAPMPGGLAYLYGNAIKYLMRWPHKGARVQDLRKCIKHIEMMIEEIENAQVDKVE